MGALREDQYTFLIIPRSVLLIMTDVPDKSCRENQNTHLIFISFSFFFRKSFRLRDNVELYCTAEEATDDNMAHAHGMLDT